LCLLVKSVAEDQRIITVSADKDLIQDALVCNLSMYGCTFGYLLTKYEVKMAGY